MLITFICLFSSGLQILHETFPYNYIRFSTNNGNSESTYSNSSNIYYILCYLNFLKSCYLSWIPINFFIISSHLFVWFDLSKMYYSFGPLIKDSVSSTISKDCLKFYASITKFWLIFLKSLLSQHEISIYGHIFFISLFCLLSTTINFCFKSYIPNNSNSLGLVVSDLDMETLFWTNLALAIGLQNEQKTGLKTKSPCQNFFWQGVFNIVCLVHFLNLIRRYKHDLEFRGSKKKIFFAAFFNLPQESIETFGTNWNTLELF